MTKAGAERIRQELNRLKKEERPRIIAAIQEARAHGDLSENAEYSAAKEEQSLMEGQIQYLETSLAEATIITVSQLPQTGRVVFGVTVRLLNDESNQEEAYQIVGEAEADINAKRISITSPLARALVGKEIGEEVIVQAPRGNMVYEILAIEYLD